MQNLQKEFEKAGFKPQPKTLADFQEAYGLEGDEEDSDEDEDEDSDCGQDADESGDEMEE